MVEQNTNLTQLEKEIIQGLANEKDTSKKILSIGIAEFLTSPSSGEEKWTPMIKAGVALFVKDEIKKSFFVEIISLSEGKIIWSQNIDVHVLTQRRRRWILVFETGFRKLMLNFVDDDEADGFADILFSRISKLKKKQVSDSTIRYFVTESGRVEYQDKNARKEEHKQKVIDTLLEKANLPKEARNDPVVKIAVEEAYEEYNLEEMENSDYEDFFENDYYYEEASPEQSSQELSSETTTPSPLFRQSESWPPDESPVLNKGQELSRIKSDPPVPSPTSKTLPNNLVSRTAAKQLPTPPTTKVSSGMPPAPPVMQLQPAPIKANAKSATSNSPLSRASLQDQIRGGIQLRNVSANPRLGASNVKERPSNNRGVPDALMAAINQIRVAVETEYGSIDDMYREW